MAVLDEKAITGVGENDSSESSTLNTSYGINARDSDSTQREKPIQAMTEDQYPHGLRLVLLAGATTVAVFLISLDQVSTWPSRTEKIISNTMSM